MSFFSAFNKLDFVKEDIHQVSGITKTPEAGDAVEHFLRRAGRAAELMLAEKEIFSFALLQWTAIGLGYYLWVQMLGWIPEEVWRSTETSDSGSIADIVLLAWSFMVVGLVAFPLGILSACIGAAHFLRRRGGSSSIAACMRMVLPRIWSLWLFHWIDGWITVDRILDRLPKKRRTGEATRRALDEALYYAWKLGTIGILPALISGRGLVDAGKQSILLVRWKLRDAALLRTGYSFICWMVGIAAYLGTILMFITFPDLLPRGEAYSFVYLIYLWAGVPIVVAAGIIQLFLRPIYVISSCDIYCDYLEERGEPMFLPPAPGRVFSALVAFLVLGFIVGVVFLYRKELGIMDMLATPYK